MTTGEVSGYEGSTRLALRIKRWLIAAFGLGFLVLPSMCSSSIT